MGAIVGELSMDLKGILSESYNIEKIWWSGSILGSLGRYTCASVLLLLTVIRR
jgi:hypothetical protein